MKHLEFTIFEKDATPESIQDVMARATKSEELRNNPAFHYAINELYKNLTWQEDAFVSESATQGNRETNAQIKHFSMMRALLVDLVRLLDTFVDEGRNLRDHNDDDGLSNTPDIL